MDNKRYQVFVSSTYQDLTDERAAVIQAILNLDHLPAGMEMFPAANADQMTLIRRVIDESDYYVVVVAGRYGSVDAEGISYTEQEYDYAVQTGKPILGFVHGDPDRIEVGKTDQNDAARKKLAEFRKKVESRMVRHFTSPAELGGHVTTSLVRAIKDDPGIGWVRGDHAMTAETQRELSTLRERLALAERELMVAQVALADDARTDVRSLLQGSDEVRIPLRLTTLDHILDADMPTIDRDVTTTWDELFADLGPKMLGEASTVKLMSAVGAHLAARSNLHPGQYLARRLDSTGGLRGITGGVAQEDWDKIQLQYEALGLMELGQRQRDPTDYGIYLRLTERGHQHLIDLRAMRRDLETN